MMLHSASKDVTEESVAAILKAADVEPDAAKIKALIASLDGVDISEAIANASVAAAAPAAAAAPTASAAPEKEQEEEEEEEVSEEEAAAGLSALFG